MKLLIYFVVFFVLLTGMITSNQVSDSMIKDSCKKASRQEEAHFYELCVTSVRENPESKKVRKIDELIIVGLRNAMSEMNNVRGVVEKILRERKYNKSKLSEKSLRDCLKLYSEGNDSLTKALKGIKSRDYHGANMDFDNAKTAPRSCEMGFNGDNNQTSPVTRENDVLFEMIVIPQAFNYDAHLDS